MMKHKQATKVQDITRDFFQAFQKLLHQVDLDVMERIVWRLSVARKNGSMIYLAGNGGSASTASHWVNDLGKATKKPGRSPIRVVSLNDNISWLTALANPIDAVIPSLQLSVPGHDTTFLMDWAPGSAMPISS